MSNLYDLTDAFDKAVTNLSKAPNKPEFIIDAVVEVHDTLKLANASAKAIFGKAVSHDITVKIYEMVEASRASKVNNFNKNKYPDAWLINDSATIDKANELGIEVLPEYSIAALRYKIYIVLQEGTDA